jgi:Spy/CpxP family protein refolding chaperone
MKRIVIWSTAVVVLVLIAGVVVRAGARRGGGWCGHRWHRPGLVSHFAHALNLDRAQKAKIQTIWEAERPTISADLHEFLAEDKEMNAIAVQGNSDPSKVQEIADREATTIAKLLVDKMRVQSKIYSTVLTAEQRAKADELQSKWESRLERVADRVGTASVKQ